MDGTFVPEGYVHIRGYYYLIDLKTLHKLRAVLVKAIGKDLTFFEVLFCYGFSQTVGTLRVCLEQKVFFGLSISLISARTSTSSV